MAKQKISITIDSALAEKIENLIEKRNGQFRNRSHVLEYGLRKLLDDKDNKEDK
ncbi:MAG: ribbon-helix-helix domain-containing protein [Nanoarchaeota archaeon]|nr:ribbon-helix-helix domain-containing protein [Nanoarchaeota archaeon]MBU0977882.1 ribbon-helix-helix domain-containing protein [Nanoarchaeota archaeon]